MAEVEAIHADPCTYDTEPQAKPRRTRKNRHQWQRWIGIKRPRNIVLNQQSSTIINTSVTNTSNYHFLNNTCNTALSSRHFSPSQTHQQDSARHRPNAKASRLPATSSSFQSLTLHNARQVSNQVRQPRIRCQSRLQGRLCSH